MLLTARLLSLVLGAIGVVWGAVAFPIFWEHAPVERVAKLIVNGHQYKRQTLVALLPVMQRIEAESLCRSSALTASAVIRLRLVEDATAAADRQLMEEQLEALPASVRAALVCSPANPFLWTSLFWLDTTQNGLRPEQMRLLRMSYRSGANEGWVGIRRNRLAFSVFELLPPDLADLAVGEFLGLLNSAFFRPAEQIFTGPAWRVRDRIMARMEEVSLGNRQVFARQLYIDGFDVSVPGVPQREVRPWRR
jgi:hypothetical protein